MSVTSEAIKTATAGLDFKKSIDRFRGGYIRRRVERLHADARTASWNAGKLSAQVTAEMAVVQAYIAGKRALIDDADPAPLTHVALKIQSALITLSVDNGAFGQRFFDGLEKELRTNRADAVAQIVWRAVALHPNLLLKTPAATPQLQQAALDELVDRRLRAIEQMHWNVNSVGFGRSGRPWKVSGPTGPWIDGYRSRSFEYPEAAPLAPFAPFLPQMTNWTVYHGRAGGGVIHRPNTPVTERFPNTVAPAWNFGDPFTWIEFQSMPQLSPAEVIQELFTPRADFWDRSWLHCDQVGSLVGLDALWFALHRRTRKDDDFNNVMKRSKYVFLGPVVGSGDDDKLMADDNRPGGDPFFENLDVELDELQVGDFVRFWSSRIYALLPPYHGAWTSEFSLVMRLELEGASGKVAKPLSGGPQIWLSGHGVATTLYNKLATEIAYRLTTRFADARNFLANVAPSINDQIDPQAPQGLKDLGHRYVRWYPYEKFDAPGAWWVEIPEEVWKGKWGYDTRDRVLSSVPRTIAAENGGQGYNPPPKTAAVYFPLFEPAIAQTPADGDSWRAYLRQRKANPQFQPLSTKLNDLTIDGRLAQGLFYRGSKSKVAVVRPLVRP